MPAAPISTIRNGRLSNPRIWPHAAAAATSRSWYRTPLTIPAKIDDFDPSGAVAVLRVTVDDYAEIWVNGAIPGRSGYPRPASIQGHNMPNRVVLGTSIKPGEKFQIAVFGINGPISIAPANAIFVREAKLELFK